MQKMMDCQPFSPWQSARSRPNLQTRRPKPSTTNWTPEKSPIFVHLYTKSRIIADEALDLLWTQASKNLLSFPFRLTLLACASSLLLEQARAVVPPIMGSAMGFIGGGSSTGSSSASSPPFNSEEGPDETLSASDWVLLGRPLSVLGTWMQHNEKF